MSPIGMPPVTCDSCGKDIDITTKEGQQGVFELRAYYDGEQKIACSSGCGASLLKAEEERQVDTEKEEMAKSREMSEAEKDLRQETA